MKVLAPLAEWYDFLAHLVFGKTWNELQSRAASDLNLHKNVLIIGGGTGKILEELNHPTVTYLELSPSMIQKARTRKTTSRVGWINDNFLTWTTDQKYDAIYCPFFLDVFTLIELKIVIQKISKFMEDGGSFYVLDFQRGNWFQQQLTRLMIFFFKVFAGLKSGTLNDISHHIRAQGWEVTQESLYFDQWIFYRSFVKSV